jgi:hypothetical protein
MAIDPNLNKNVKDTAKVVEEALKNISEQVRDIFEQSLGQTNKFSDSIVANINKGIRDVARSAETFESNLNKYCYIILIKINQELRKEYNKNYHSSIIRKINIKG